MPLTIFAAQDVLCLYYPIKQTPHRAHSHCILRIYDINAVALREISASHTRVARFVEYIREYVETLLLSCIYIKMRNIRANMCSAPPSS